MKKYLFVFCFLLLAITCVKAQYYSDLNFSLKDSLKLVASTSSSLKKIDILFNIGGRYMWSQGDTAIKYYSLVEKIAVDSKDNLSLFWAYNSISQTYSQTIGNYPLGLHFAVEALKLGNKNKFDDSLMSFAYFDLALCYSYLKNKELGLKYLILSNPFSRRYIPLFDFTMPKVYYILEMYDTAYYYNTQVLDYYNKKVYEKRWSGAYVVQGDIYRAQKKYDSAIINYKLSIPLSFISSLYKDYLEASSGLTSTYAALHQVDSAIHYGRQVVIYSEKFTFTEGLLNAYKVLYQMYKVKNMQDSAFKYLEKSQQLSEQLYNSSKTNEAQNLALGEMTKANELSEQKATQQKELILTIALLLIFGIGIYFNGKRVQKNRIKKIEDDRKNNELSAARDLQQSMLPKELPQRSDLDIATFIRSSTEVGGDYYDFFPQTDGSLFSVCGDATGHGVASGMMVSVTKAGLNGINPVKPHKILQRLNGVIKRIDLGILRMSLNIVEITQDELFLSSAAMPPIYLYKAATKEVEEFMNNGLPLGGLKDENFVLENRKFDYGDVLVQLSDGLPEAPNLVGEMYDYDRLRNLIQSSCHLSAQEIIDVLIKSVDEWMQGNRNPDDITIVVIKKQ